MCGQPFFKIMGCALLLLCALSPAGAQVTVYNNFGPGNNGWDYNWGLGWTVAGVNVPAQYGVEQAMGFAPTASGVVSDIWVAMWYVPIDPQPDEVTVRLTRNPNGLPPKPEDVMEEWKITKFESWTHWSPPHHLKGDGTSYIEQGKSYWLWASGGDTTWCGWCMNEDPKLTCPHTLRREGENWLPVADETASAFRVDTVLDYGLAADVYSLQENTGGEVSFGLGAGLPNAGRSYLLLGSVTGTIPGTPLPGGMATLPINYDLFTQVVISLLNTPVFKDFMGVLGADGTGAAEMNTLGPVPGAAGITMHFAYALNAPWDYASNPVAVTIVP